MVRKFKVTASSNSSTLKVTPYVINKGQSGEYYGLKNAEDNQVLTSAPNNWKSKKGAIAWAKKKGYEVVESACGKKSVKADWVSKGKKSKISKSFELGDFFLFELGKDFIGISINNSYPKGKSWLGARTISCSDAKGLFDYLQNSLTDDATWNQIERTVTKSGFDAKIDTMGNFISDREMRKPVTSSYNKKSVKASKVDGDDMTLTFITPDLSAASMVAEKAWEIGGFGSTWSEHSWVYIDVPATQSIDNIEELIDYAQNNGVYLNTKSANELDKWLGLVDAACGKKSVKATHYKAKPGGWNYDNPETNKFIFLYKHRWYTGYKTFDECLADVIDTVGIDNIISEGVEISKENSAGYSVERWDSSEVYEAANDASIARNKKSVKAARYSDAVPYENRKYWYFTTHGIGPGMLPKGVNILDTQEGQNRKGTWGDYILLDAVLNTDELRQYDLVELAPLDKESPIKPYRNKNTISVFDSCNKGRGKKSVKAGASGRWADDLNSANNRNILDALEQSVASQYHNTTINGVKILVHDVRATVANGAYKFEVVFLPKDYDNDASLEVISDANSRGKFLCRVKDSNANIVDTFDIRMSGSKQAIFDKINEVANMLSNESIEGAKSIKCSSSDNYNDLDEAMRFRVCSYYDTKFRDLAECKVFDDFDEAVDYAHECLGKGPTTIEDYYVGTVEIDPDEYWDNFDGEFWCTPELAEWRDEVWKTMSIGASTKRRNDTKVTAAWYEGGDIVMYFNGEKIYEGQPGADMYDAILPLCQDDETRLKFQEWCNQFGDPLFDDEYGDASETAYTFCELIYYDFVDDENNYEDGNGILDFEIFPATEEVTGTKSVKCASENISAAEYNQMLADMTLGILHDDGYEGIGCAVTDEALSFYDGTEDDVVYIQPTDEITPILGDEDDDAEELAAAVKSVAGNAVEATTYDDLEPITGEDEDYGYGFDSNGEAIPESTVDELYRIAEREVLPTTELAKVDEYATIMEDTFEYYASSPYVGVTYTISATFDTDDIDVVSYALPDAYHYDFRGGKEVGELEFYIYVKGNEINKVELIWNSSNLDPDNYDMEAIEEYVKGIAKPAAEAIYNAITNI